MNIASRVSSLLALHLLAGAPALGQWSTARLSQPREGLAATTVGARAMFAGGAGGSLTDVIDVYDHSLGLPPSDPAAWSTAHLSQPRWFLAAASVGSKALFSGGYDASGNASAVVDIYDGSSGLPPSNPAAWSTRLLSQPLAEHHATTVGTKVMFAGYSSVVDVYDDSLGLPASHPGAWSTASLSQPHAGLAVTAVGTKAMFAGGHGSVVVDIYDDSQGLPPSDPSAWSTAALSEPRFLPGATTIGSKAMFAAGDGSDTVDIYDDSLGLPPSDPTAWSTAVFPSGEYRIASAATTVGDKAIFAGGFSSLCGIPCRSNTADIYDDATGTWSTDHLVTAGVTSGTTVGTMALFAGGCEWPCTFGFDVVDVYDLDFGERYCTPAFTNSTGLPGVLTVVGRTSLGSYPVNDFSLIAEQLPAGQPGYFLTGQTQGFFNPAGSQGLSCLSGNIGRYNQIPSLIQGPTGSIGIDLSSIPVNPPQAVLPGDTWNFQCWYRDINPILTSNFTDAVSVTFQ